VIGVTADTNIYVSSLVFGGVPRQFIRAAEDGQFQLAISEPLIAEFREVLRRRFKLPEEDIADALAQLATYTELVHPTQTLDAVPDDPDDNRVLECAVAANSGYIVTGDNDLLQLGSYGGIRIVKVADFLRLQPTL
jgi:putative PIN family toxin of toxin-antitoxin system